MAANLSALVLRFAGRYRYRATQIITIVLCFSAAMHIAKIVERQTSKQFQFVGYHLAIYRGLLIPTSDDDTLQRRNAINPFGIAVAFEVEIENPEINKIGV